MTQPKVKILRSLKVNTNKTTKKEKTLILNQSIFLKCIVINNDIINTSATPMYINKSNFIPSITSLINRYTKTKSHVKNYEKRVP